MLIVCFTQCTLFFLFFSFLFSVSLFPIANLFAVRYLWDICNADKCWVVTHRAVDLFTCLVYVRTYCVPVKTLNQNERTRFFSTYVCLLIAANLNKGRMQRPYHPWFILPYSYLIHLLGGLACFLFHEYTDFMQSNFISALYGTGKCSFSTSRDPSSLTLCRGTT